MEAKKEVKKDDQLAGGHAGAFKFLPDGTLLKAGKKGEIAFYSDFNNPTSKYYSEMQLLKPYMPQFHGIVELDGKPWIKMQNLCANLTNVSFIDIKMGSQTYSPEDPPSKIANQQQRAKETTSFEYGFRITGVTIRDEHGTITFKIQKEFSGISIKDAKEILVKFLSCNGAKAPNKEAVLHYIEKIREILKLWENNISRMLIASSLFFVLSNTDNAYYLRIIDFAHAFPLEEGKKDFGFIKGLKSLIQILEEIAEK